MNPIPLIVKKRDGGTHTNGEIASLVSGYLGGEVAEYQMSAWLMAAFLRGLDETEAMALTEAMQRSGRVLDLRSIEGPRVDKHSTGGVGDKISICLAPAVAACGAYVPMIAGRGLGHTGGTVDKLAAIPGYSTHLDVKRFERVVREVGVSIMGQTDEIAPADARLYALRDVTGTVESVPLIVASILSKKLAEGIDALVLDVKVGRGAFMKDAHAAQRLAQALVDIGTRAGKKVSALLTDMSAPIGRTIGNSLETREAIEVLRGGGPRDARELTLELGAEMLFATGLASSPGDGSVRIARALDGGAGLETFRRMVEAHGGDPRVADDVSLLPTAPHRVPVRAQRSGTIQDIDALALGLLSTSMGAGRTRAGETIDPAVGIELSRSVGDPVVRGEPLAWLHVRGEEPPADWLDRARGSMAIGEGAPDLKSLVLGRLGQARGEGAPA